MQRLLRLRRIEDSLGGTTRNSFASTVCLFSKYIFVDGADEFTWTSIFWNDAPLLRVFVDHLEAEHISDSLRTNADLTFALSLQTQRTWCNRNHTAFEQVGRSSGFGCFHPWHPGHPFVLHFRIQVSVYGRQLWQDSCFLQSWCVSNADTVYRCVYTYIIPLSVFGESWVHFKSCTTSDFNVQPLACHCARATVTLLPGLRCLRLILFCLSHCSMQIPRAWKQPWLLTLKERSFFSCFLLIASLLALAWRGRQSGRPTTTVRMPTVATSDAWEDRNWYASLSNATFSLRLWYQLPHPLWGRDESDEPSARAWAGRCFTSRVWPLWLLFTGHCSLQEWRALLRIDCLLGLCLDAKWDQKFYRKHSEHRILWRYKKLGKTNTF